MLPTFFGSGKDMACLSLLILIFASWNITKNFRNSNVPNKGTLNYQVSI